MGELLDALKSAARAFRTVGANRYSSAKIKRSMALNVCLLGECRLSMLI